MTKIIPNMDKGSLLPPEVFDISRDELKEILGRVPSDQDMEDATMLALAVNKGDHLKFTEKNNGLPRPQNYRTFDLWKAATRLEKYVEYLLMMRRFEQNKRISWIMDETIENITVEDIQNANFQNKINALEKLHKILNDTGQEGDALLKLTINIKDSKTREVKEGIVIEYLNKINMRNPEMARVMLEKAIASGFDPKIIDLPADSVTEHTGDNGDE